MKKREPIRQGEEKFFLKNGDSYALVRPGKWDIFFVVPKRPSTNPGPPPNVDVLNFPSSI